MNQTLMDRIERALARIEAALARPAPAVSSNQESLRALAELSARHDMLKTETQAALDALSNIIVHSKVSG